MSSHYSTVKNSHLGEKTEKSYSEIDHKSQKDSAVSEDNWQDFRETILKDIPEL